MSIEKCRGCAYLNPKMHHCGKYLRGIETAIYLCQKEYKQTNADRIRSMTDEELADFFFKDPFRAYMKTPKENLDWLKQEATE